MSGAGTIFSNNWREVRGQSNDPGMRGTGTARAVSPACRVLVRVTVRQAPESLKWKLPLEKLENGRTVETRNGRTRKKRDWLCEKR